MDDGNTKAGIEMRRDSRVGINEQVTVELLAGPMVGSGDNLSLQGVYFTTTGPIPVSVRIGDGSVVRGELIRVEAMGDERVGIAVRFLEPVAGLMPD